MTRFEKFHHFLVRFDTQVVRKVNFSKKFRSFWKILATVCNSKIENLEKSENFKISGSGRTDKSQKPKFLKSSGSAGSRTSSIDLAVDSIKVERADSNLNFLITFPLCFKGQTTATFPIHGLPRTGQKMALHRAGEAAEESSSEEEVQKSFGSREV